MKTNWYKIIFALALLSLLSCSSGRDELLISMQKVSEKVSDYERVRAKLRWAKLGLEVDDNGYKPADVDYLNKAHADLTIVNTEQKKDSLNSSLISILQERFKQSKDKSIQQDMLKLLSRYDASYSKLFDSDLGAKQQKNIQHMLMDRIQGEVVDQYFYYVGATCCWCYSRIFPYAIFPAKKLQDGDSVTATILLTVSRPQKLVFVEDSLQDPYPIRYRNITTIVEPGKLGFDTFQVRVGYESGGIQHAVLKYPYRIGTCQ